MNKKIKIGNLVYEVENMEDSFEQDDYLGRTWPSKQVIRINPNISKELTEQTLLHEIIHCILDQGGYNQENQDEKLVNYISSSIYQVLKENNLFE